MVSSGLTRSLALMIPDVPNAKMLQSYTVKVSNFEPHGNFGPFLARFVASLDELCTKNE
jgi:hypothetical protein